MAAAQERLDGTRVAIMGGSYGGYLTMVALARLPDLFASGVAFVGVANWLTTLEGASPQLKASDRIEYGDIDNPADREFFRQISPLTHAHHVRAPAMIIHGANDPRDPVTESDQSSAPFGNRAEEWNIFGFRMRGIRFGSYQTGPELPVTDVERAQQHYRDVLGLEIGWL